MKSQPEFWNGRFESVGFVFWGMLEMRNGGILERRGLKRDGGMRPELWRNIDFEFDEKN